MKVVCDASGKCEEGDTCSHHLPHKVRAGCDWPCCAARILGKSGKCVQVGDVES